MPVSGSYYYPVVQAPNSSYPTVDLRPIPTAPAGTGLGKLFVLQGTDDLYYKDPSGNVIPVVAASGTTVFDLLDAQTVYNSRGHLVLSSALGSMITISGSLTLRGGPIVHSGQHLILSSSAGSNIHISGALSVLDGITAAGGGQLFWRSSHATKAVSMGTVGTEMLGVYSAAPVIRAASTVDFCWETRARLTSPLDGRIALANYAGNNNIVLDSVTGSIVAGATHLVLSSSAGSVVTVSGTLKIAAPYGITTDNAAASNFGDVAINDNNDPSFYTTNNGTLGLGQGSSIFFGNANNALSAAKMTRISSLGTGSIGLSGSDGTVLVAARTGHLILSSSNGSIVSVSGGLNVIHGSLNSPLGTSAITNFAQWTANGTQSMALASANGTITLSPATAGLGFSSTAGVGVKLHSSTGHLILSSSTGAGNAVIAMSGAVKVGRETTATLPAGADVLTGTIVWDDTRKTLKIYGPEGWCPIITGSAG